jgi:hypothetical protein
MAKRALHSSARHDLEMMVAKHAASLQQQKVFVFNMCICHADIRRQASSSSLKIKLRMNGKTCLKSSSTKASLEENDLKRFTFDAIGSIIFEGGDALHFELCQPSSVGASRPVAMARIPLAEALGPAEDCASSSRPACSLHTVHLFAVGSPGKILGSLTLELAIRTTTLQGAGGIWALKTRDVPEIPNIYGPLASAQPTDDERAECNAFAEQALIAIQCLDAVLNSAMNARRLLARNVGSSKDQIDTFDDASTFCESDSRTDSRTDSIELGEFEVYI